MQDLSVFDEQIERYWHLAKVVNVFLRWQIETTKLLACVRDPETGQILRLGSEGWLPSKWDEYIPSGIWTDFIDPDFYDAPGPTNAIVRGRQRPIFFLSKNFEAWFATIFGSTPDLPWKVASSKRPDDNIAIPKLGPVMKSQRRQAAILIIHAVFGPSGPHPGLTEKVRNEQINGRAKSLGVPKLSDSTIRRALKTMRRFLNVFDRC